MSGQQRYSPSFERRAFLASFAGLAWGCSGSARLEARFDPDGLGPPVEFPLPTPPNDRMFWSTARSSASVMVRSGANRWVRIQPTPAYGALSYPKRATALMALSEPFSGTSQPVHGELSVSMTGTGVVLFVLHALQGPNWEGGALAAIAYEATGQSSSIAYLSSFEWNGLGNDPTGHRRGTFLANYDPGSLSKIAWSLDQTTRSISLREDPAGKQANVAFPNAAPSGVSLTPIQRMMLTVELYEANSDVVIFLDDVVISEL